jgi:hypothetical protein
LEIIENKYNILFNSYYTSLPDYDWSTLSISFRINLKNNSVKVPINYRVQSIDNLVDTISKKLMYQF